MLFELLKLSKALSGGEGAFEAYNVMEKCGKMSEAELNAYRNSSFLKLVDYCYQFVPYYRNFMLANDLHPTDFTTTDQISVFPILTKDILRAQESDFVSQKINTIKYTTRRSGGTTGEPVLTMLSEKASAFEVFAHFKGMQILGWDPGMDMIKIFGGSLGLNKKKNVKTKLLDYATNSHYLAAFKISKSNIDEVLDDIWARKNPVLIGYASAIYNLALYSQYSVKYKNKLRSKIKIAVTTSELLPDSWKHYIAETFACSVKSYYGCGEINGIGYQQKDSDEYFVMDENIYLEQKQDNQKVSDLLVTQFHNTAKPLIRYQNGDMGSVYKNNGRTYISLLAGRTADMIKKADGTIVSSIFGTYSIQISRIQVYKYQYIQIGFTEFDFVYEPVNEDITEEEKKTLLHMLSDTLQTDKVKVNFIKNGDFVVSPNGKHRIVICKI